MFMKICQAFKPILRQAQHWSFRPISISLSPNTEKDDVWLAFKLLFQPWRWQREVGENGFPVIELERKFQEYLGVKYAISFNSGRSALMAILSSFGLEKDSEVLLQAFTCNAVPNPVIWSNLKPVFIDVDEKTFNIDVEDLKRKISPKSKIVIVQHTFGLPAFAKATEGKPADIDEILEICRQGEEDKSSSSPFAEARGNNLILIEDCAHSLGAEYKGKKVGTFGRAAFFSFSRDKVISSVYGGMAVTNDEKLGQALRQAQGEFGYPKFVWIFQQLLHPVLMNWLILPTYKFLGKYLLVLFQWLQILSKAVHWKEKRGEKPCYFPKRMPEALAILALNQFKKLGRFNEHRQKIAHFYYDNLKDTLFDLPPVSSSVREVFLRFTVRHSQAHDIIKKAWRKNILIGDWYTSPVAPYDTRLDKLQYKLGSCPKAEKLSKETLNLPTHINISFDDAKKIIEFLKQYN